MGRNEEELISYLVIRDILNQCIFVFDPEFETYCDEMAQKLVANKTDKNIIGYFSDNELPFGPKNLEGYLTLKNPNDPGRLYAESWLKRQGITLQQITDEHREEFAGVVAERYYKWCRKRFGNMIPITFI